MHEATLDELSKIFAQAKPRARKTKRQTKPNGSMGTANSTMISASNSTIIIGPTDSKKN